MKVTSLGCHLQIKLTKRCWMHQALGGLTLCFIISLGKPWFTIFSLLSHVCPSSLLPCFFSPPSLSFLSGLFNTDVPSCVSFCSCVIEMLTALSFRRYYTGHSTFNATHMKCYSPNTDMKTEITKMILLSEYLSIIFLSYFLLEATAAAHGVWGFLEATVLRAWCREAGDEEGGKAVSVLF